MNAGRAAGHIWVAAAVLSLLAACSDSAAPETERTPDDARIVTDDIARFWTAFDKIQHSVDTLPLRRDYLDPGTIGLKDMTAARWRTAANLTALVWPRRAYYASIRSNTLQVHLLESEIRAVYRNLDQRYPAAVFPDVYFVIGGLSTGGTVSSNGLLIGTELFSRAVDSPLDGLTPWQQSVVRGSSVIPSIVAHELTHFQQRFGSEARTLLAQSIQEGSADFVGALLSGRVGNEALAQYGAAHEAELWDEFKRAMNGTDISRWLYNGGSVTSGDSRPADLGYYIGMRITEAYYDRAADKNAALRDIFTISDFPGFLAASGYAARFQQ